VGDHLRSKDELRKEWERFQAAAAREKEVRAACVARCGGLIDCNRAATRT